MKACVLYDRVVHHWLRVPYSLHVTEYRSPKKPKETIIFIHGMGNSSAVWHEVWKDLPRDVRVIGIDMLGFGDSPRPSWVKYDVKIQMKAMAHTILRLNLHQRPILVGHSMGSLVSIELAKKFPFAIKRLVLCSPPIYKTTSDDWLAWEGVLRDFYRLVTKHPDKLEQIAPLARKLGIITNVFNVEGENAKVYVEALEASIINQSSLEDVRVLRLPINILYGTFDPVVVGATLKKLDRDKSNITVKSFPVGHEILGKYSRYIAKEIYKIIHSV